MFIFIYNICTHVHTKHFYSFGATIDVGEPESNSRSDSTTVDGQSSLSDW